MGQRHYQNKPWQHVGYRKELNVTDTQSGRHHQQPAGAGEIRHHVRRDRWQNNHRQHRQRHLNNDLRDSNGHYRVAQQRRKDPGGK